MLHIFSLRDITLSQTVEEESNIFLVMRKFAVIDERHKTCSFFSEQECNFLLPEPQGIVRLIPIDVVVETM